MFVKRIADNWYPKAKKIKLVMDNFKTHDASTFYETFEQQKQKDFGIGLNLYIPPTWQLAKYCRDRITCIKWSMPKSTYINFSL